MKRRWMLYGMRFVVFAIVAGMVFGFVAMSLWNWLMPAVFGLHAITFWQAIGLLILSRVLLGGFRGGPHGMRWRRRMMERWEQMSPEERARFREGMQHRCGHFQESAEEAKS